MERCARLTLTGAARPALLLVAMLSVVAACGRSRSPGGRDEPRGGSAGESEGGRGGASGMTTGGEAGVEFGGRGGDGPIPTAGTANSGSAGQVNTGGTTPIGGAGGAVGGNGGAVGGEAGASNTAGEAGDSALPLPEGCEPRGRTEDANQCSLGVFCDGAANLTSCERRESGLWQCSCELGNNHRLYEIDGAPGVEACAVAAGLCSEDELELGAETCGAEFDTHHSNGCERELRCETPISVWFAPEVQASLVRYASGSCLRDSGGLPFACGCLAGDAGFEYGLLADSGALACGPLVDFCMSGATPVFDEPTVCFPTGSTLESGACSLDESCATPMRLTDDVSLAHVESSYASCVASGAASANCYCSTRAGYFAFDVEAEPVADTCASSILNCREGTSITPEGGVTCGPTSQSAGVDFCEADLDCLQPASVDGRSIVAHGRLLVRCQRAGAQEPWWCSCASNQDSAIFELGAEGVSPWDACGEAPRRCVEEMPVFIGIYGEFLPPPDPLPGEQ